MSVQVVGQLVTEELDRVEILTTGGVAYELAVPLRLNPDPTAPDA